MNKLKTDHPIRVYCTLFDKNYLSRGLALHHSLITHSSKPVFLHILAMDEECYRILNKLKLKNVKVIHLENEFLNDELKVAKSNRTWAEFCWTCSSALIRYVFNQGNVDQLTYLDSDLYFFDDPEIIFGEFGDQNSALITDHFYYRDHDQSAASGRFCVQFLPFNRNENGQKVLEHWYRQCLKDCSLSPERGICGDQKYLDEWPSQYDHVVISTQQGAGVAPWNVERYQFSEQDRKIVLKEKNVSFQVIFYHFHGLAFFDSDRVQLSGARYRISRFLLNHIYKPYFFALEQAAHEVSRVGEKTSHAVKKDERMTWKKRVRSFLSFLRGNVNASILSTDIFFIACTVCGNENVATVRTRLFDDRYGFPGYFDLVACRSCQHFFLRNEFKNSDFTELYTKFYPRAALLVDDFQPNTLLGGWSGWALGEKCSAFSWVPKNTTVLDVGCGFGQSVAYHAARGCVAVGVDADENVRRVSEKYGLDIRVGLFNLDLFKNESFKYITLDQVLEHSQYPEKFLRDLTALLDHDGKIVLSIPNAFGLGAKIFGKRWIHWHTPYHLQFFSHQSLRKLVEQVGGLEIESVRYRTHSHWILYQWAALLVYPQMGTASAFWNNGKFNVFQKVARKILGWMLKLGLFTAYTRLLDFLRLGDNQVIILKKKNEN